MIKRIIHQRILAVPHSMRSLRPVERDEIRVENTLFGWVLRLRKEQVSCSSEAEARYLAAFVQMGFAEAPVPSDPERISQVLPDLERSVSKLWAQIEEKTSSELNPSRRKELVNLVWENVRERIDMPKEALTQS